MGARIESADGMNDESVNGEFMRGIMDLMAQHERLLIRQRTKAALDVKRKRGEKLGGHAPYGFRAEGEPLKLTEIPEEQAVIARVQELAGAQVQPQSLSC
jgi:DNA invertase Pin-like site-specific DNA recombinase